MPAKSLIEVADRQSRLRAILFAVATLVFVFVQALTHGVFTRGAYAHGWRLYVWVFNEVVLLLCLGGGGGVLNPAPVRALVQDEVAQAHNRTACKTGFWVAMFCGLVLFVVPPFSSFTGQQVIYVLVTVSTAAALLVFSWLEYRAHADA